MKTVFFCYRKLRAKTLCVLIRVVKFLLAILSRWYPLKLILLRTDRLGHLALNTESFLRKMQIEGRSQTGTDAFLFISYWVKSPCNVQLLKMISRRLPVIKNNFLCELFLRAGFFLDTGQGYEYSDVCTESEVFYQSGPQLSFSSEELEKGRAFLSSAGMGVDDWYVCIFARDGAYMSDRLSNIPGCPSFDAGNDYRNVDIDDFEQACVWLLEQGAFIFRMGSLVEKPLRLQHERLIDYASNGLRTDFLDVFLPAFCRFFLCTPSGCADVATIFDRPLAVTNMVPPGLHPIGKNSVFIPKHIFREGKRLSYRELISSGLDRELFNTESWVKNGLSWENNAPAEILELAKEMYQRCTGEHRPNEEHQQRMEKYRSVFAPENIAYNNRNEVGEDFLERYFYLF